MTLKAMGMARSSCPCSKPLCPVSARFKLFVRSGAMANLEGRPRRGTQTRP
jgi:hypothetical protein